MKIEWHPAAAKEFSALDKAVQQRIARALREKVLNAREPMLEPYHGDLKGFHKLRVGPYRLVCRLSGQQEPVLCVLLVGHRSEVYAPDEGALRSAGWKRRIEGAEMVAGPRQRVSSGSLYEPVIGFSRAVRVGPQVFVGGTAPIGSDGQTVGVGDPAAQTRRCCEIAGQALEKLGASFADVVRTRIFITRLEDWEAIGAAHGEVFGDIRPAATMVRVAGLLDPDWLVEIEFDAVVGGE